MVIAHYNLAPDWINTTDEYALTLYYLCIFAAFSVATLVLVAARALAIANATIGGARQLHEELSAAILRAPVSFFDTTPVGRIVTRFAYDTECVDSTLPQQLQQFFEVFFVILGIFGVVVVVSPWMLLPMLPVLVAYNSVQAISSFQPRRSASIPSLVAPFTALFRKSCGHERHPATQDTFVASSDTAVDRNTRCYVNMVLTVG